MWLLLQKQTLSGSWKSMHMLCETTSKKRMTTKICGRPEAPGINLSRLWSVQPVLREQLKHPWGALTQKVNVGLESDQDGVVKTNLILSVQSLYSECCIWITAESRGIKQNPTLTSIKKIPSYLLTFYISVVILVWRFPFLILSFSLCFSWGDFVFVFKTLPPS